MTKLSGFERDRYLRMLFRQLPGGVWMTDRNLCLTYVVGRLANNMSPRAKPGMSIYDIVGTRDPANRLIASHLAALSGNALADPRVTVHAADLMSFLKQQFACPALKFADDG